MTATALLILSIPIVNYFLITATGDIGFISSNGIPTLKGAILLAGFTGLVLLATYLRKKYLLLFRILVSLIYLGLPVFLVQFTFKNIVYQVTVVAFALFALLYLLYETSDTAPETVPLPRFLHFHVALQLAVIVLLTRLKLLFLLWTRISVIAYFLIFGFVLVYFLLKRDSGKNRKRGTISLVAALVVTTVASISPTIGYLLIFITLLVWLYLLLREVSIDRYLIDQLFENPYKMLLLSFSFIVLVGGLLLSMPFSSASGNAMPLIDSFFTATSAVCVTGLVVVDTYTTFSSFGQLIILCLIQVGGLGIITIMTFVSIMMGQSIGIGREFVVAETIGSQRSRLFYDLIRLIVVGTLVFETIGAAILTLGFRLSGEHGMIVIWKGVFHAISAFCNAGFALQEDSLMAYNQTLLIPLSVSLLIIIGGIGFPVVFYFRERLWNKGSIRTMPLSVKLSLIMTFALITLGYVVFLLVEYEHSFQGMPPLYKHVNAFFQSVTARTAGFNTVNMTGISEVSVLILWILMFIGAGSCSTAGGIKVTTVGVILAVVYSFIRGNSKPTVFKKEIPEDTVTRSIAILIASLIFIVVISLFLLSSQQLSMKESIFETISAFGTVGLSLDATTRLDDFGKFLIILAMFTGRVGILSFLSVFARFGKSKLAYPEEQVMVG